jgi:hypothetical protein
VLSSRAGFIAAKVVETALRSILPAAERIRGKSSILVVRGVRRGSQTRRGENTSIDLLRKEGMSMEKNLSFTYYLLGGSKG